MHEASIEVRFIVPAARKGKTRDYHNCLMQLKKAVDVLTGRVRGHIDKKTGKDTRQVGVGIIEDDDDRLTWITPPKDEQVVKQGDREITRIIIKEL